MPIIKTKKTVKPPVITDFKSQLEKPIPINPVSHISDLATSVPEVVPNIVGATGIANAGTSKDINSIPKDVNPVKPIDTGKPAEPTGTTPEGELLKTTSEGIKSTQEYAKSIGDVYAEKIADLNSGVKTNLENTNSYYDTINTNESANTKTAEDIASAKVSAINSAQEKELELLRIGKQQEINSKQTQIDNAKVDRDNILLQKEAEEKQIKISTETDRVISAINMSAIGLAFSSYAMGEYSNAISAGATKISQVKVEIDKANQSYNSKSTELYDGITKLQNNYVSESNKIIQSYSDKKDVVLSEYEKKITDIQNNLRLNATSKKQAIDKLVQEYKKEKSNIESGFLKDSKDASDSINKQTSEYYSKYLELQKTNREKLDLEYSSGNLLRLSPAEIAKKEDEAGLSRGYIMSKVQQEVTKGIRKTYDDALGSGYPIVDIGKLTNDVADLVKQGYDTTSAISAVTSRELAKNEDYKYKIGRQKMIDSQDLEYKNATLDISKGNLNVSRGNLSISADNLKLNQDKFIYQMEQDALKHSNDGLDEGPSSELNYGALKTLNPTSANLLTTPAGTWIKTRMPSTSPSNTTRGLECGEYISGITGKPAGNTYEDKKRLNSDGRGVVGDTAVWQPKGGDKNYGHIGIIIGEQGGYWKIKSSNYKVPGTITEDLVPKTDIASYGSTKLSDNSEYAGMTTTQLRNEGLRLGVSGIGDFKGAGARGSIVEAISKKGDKQFIEGIAEGTVSIDTIKNEINMQGGTLHSTKPIFDKIPNFDTVQRENAGKPIKSYISDTNSFIEDLTTRISAGAKPDVIKFIRKNTIAPLLKEKNVLYNSYGDYFYVDTPYGEARIR